MIHTKAHDTNFASTRNACNVCTPLGACLVFRGIEGAVPFLHGSQGCATYIRRYLIGHFREPMDIASSNFSESSAIFGGADNFRIGLENVIRQYNPRVVGIATTCLSETIGDDISMYLHEFLSANDGTSLPELVHVSTPSYEGTHADGFHRTVRAIVEQLASSKNQHARPSVNLFPGMLSPADLRYLRAICRDFDLEPTCLPDYSDTLDGPAWSDYHQIPPGGTPLAHLRGMGSACGSIEFAATFAEHQSAGAYLESEFGVPRLRLPMPLGIEVTDRFFLQLEELSGKPTPVHHVAERGRLVDAYVDAHKYAAGKRVALFGDEDLIVSLCAFLVEIGMEPVLCASGGNSGRLREALADLLPAHMAEMVVMSDTDFATIEALVGELKPDLLIGSSKGYAMSRSLGIPLLRVGFPIHDRIDGSRQMHVGYRGTQQLFDRIVNQLIAASQDDNPVGYMNM